MYELLDLSTPTYPSKTLRPQLRNVTFTSEKTTFIMKSTKVQTLRAGHAIVYTEVETLDREEINCHLQYVYSWQEKLLGLTLSPLCYNSNLPSKIFLLC